MNGSVFGDNRKFILNEKQINDIVEQIRKTLSDAVRQGRLCDIQITGGLRELPPNCIDSAEGKFLAANYECDGSFDFHIRIESQSMDIKDWQRIRDQLNALGDDLCYRKTEACAKV